MWLERDSYFACGGMGVDLGVSYNVFRGLEHVVARMQ